MPWIINEGAAVKAKFRGVAVNDTNASTWGLPVEVRFGLPENELSAATFPLIVIERTRTEPDHVREHRGVIQLGYTPEGYERRQIPFQSALDLLSWMPMLALTGQTRLWEPRRLRFRLFSALARHWPWTREITDALERLAPPPNPG